MKLFYFLIISLIFKGLSLSDISGTVTEFIKTLGNFVGPNYPGKTFNFVFNTIIILIYIKERIYMIFVINVPSWFNIIWYFLTIII